MQLGSVRSLKAQLASGLGGGGMGDDNIAAFAAVARAAPRVAQAKPVRVALGVAPGHGKNDFQLAARFHKSNRQSLEAARALKRAANGEVEIRFVGDIRKQAAPWYRSRQRPLLIGSSVAHFDVTAGTIGAFVYVGSGRKLHVLSNNHVLANENLGRKGDAILQPGSLDRGLQPGDSIGQLTAWEKLKFGRKNLIDAAVAEVEGVDCDRITITGQTLSLSGLRKHPLDVGEAVSKFGRTTGYRKGKVTAIEMDDVTVGYDQGDATFDNQIEIEGAGQRAFSDGGDSGSIILDAAGKACALLFAGGETGGSNGGGLTYANPIGTVMEKLKLRLAL